MTSKAKAKGNDFERYILKKAKGLGLSAERAWGSDGRSCGWDKEVDILLEGQRIQAKKGYNQPITKFKDWTKNVDACIWGGTHLSRGGPFVIMEFSKWLELVQEKRCYEDSMGESTDE